jgi:hypothetical protein
MKHLLSRLLPKVALGSLLALGLTTGFAASNPQPAQAGVVLSVGFGGGYAPGYHWHRWHDGYGWHRAWVPFGWAPPVVLRPVPAYYRPVPVAYDRPERVTYYGRPYYGREYYGHPYYGRPYYARDFHDRDFHDRGAYAHGEFHR